MTSSESQLERQIGAALARITSEFYGRGPRSTRTWVLDRLVFSALREPFTIGEEALIAAGRHGLVRDVRLTFQDVMARSFVDEVQQSTGRVVCGYHSQIVFDPPAAFEWFILDEPAGARPASDVGARAPGEVGDADAATADAAETAVGPSGGAGGEGTQRAAISNAVNRIVASATGRGSPSARAYLLGPYVLCVLEDAVTGVESTLIDAGSGELARTLRRELTDTVSGQLREAVAQVAGRPVVAIESQLVRSPDAVLLAFVLAGELRPKTAAGD